MPINDTVWLVIGDAGWGDGRYVAGVFSTLELASASIRDTGWYDIEEFELDEEPS